MNIPLTKPSITSAEEERVLEVLRSGWVTQGPQVQFFEEAFAEYVGSRFAIATSSCTTALHLALIAASVGPEDEVICPSYSFIATTNVIRYCYAKPVFIDIDRETYNLNPDLLERLITKQTKAIMIVHQVGLPAHLDPILKIASKHNLIVIEDAACAIGSEYQGEKIGKPHGFLACFSFHPRKIITSGEGGMITTNDASIARRLKKLRHQGMSVTDYDRHKAKSTVIFEKYDELGYNYRMSDLQAALGIVQLKRLPELLKIRTGLAERYHRAFSEMEHVKPPHVPPYAQPNFQSYLLRIKPTAPLSRDELMQRLLDRGITTRRGIMAAHQEPFYAAGFSHLRLPETESAVRETMILPLFPQMRSEEQEFVISSIREILTSPVALYTPRGQKL